MDRNSVTGLALIALIMIVWLQFMSPEKKDLQENKSPRGAKTELAEPGDERAAPISLKPASDTFGAFAAVSSGREELVRVDNDLFTITLSSKGATIKSVVLKKHLDGKMQPFNLVSAPEKGALSLLFLNNEGIKIDTRDLYFRPLFSEKRTTLSGSRSAVIAYRLDVGPQQAIDITYRFSGNSYKVDYDVKLTGFNNALAGNEYQLQWDGGLTYSEKNREDESQNALAGAYLGGSLVKMDAAKENQSYREEQSGEAGWVAVRNKYFAAALIPGSKTDGIYLEGKRDSGHFENYLASLKMGVPSTGSIARDHYTLYIGPLDYNTVKKLGAGLEKIMDFGWDWLTRPFAEYIILPVFTWMNGFVSNYGLIIIIFALLIKLVTYPLSMASTKSMKKMAALQPVLKDLQEKYKDNPAKLQSELGRIYKEAGVNPLGGCLPVVLQMPLLFAMFYVFRSSIQLRHHGFLWAKDLSVPDSILDFGFSIPVYGDHIAIFPILMGITVFIQQKITPTAQSNEQMKVMLYIFPVMMLLFFNNLPAGLGLYYLMFNIFSVAQQFYINSTTSADDVPQAALAAAAAAAAPKKKKGSPKK
ncbi:MAG: membrane protein insertase YidC [Chlorobium sp.]|uniref:membrane protein insertase YidC n=1 Tax=Chlorobium sp. TaxID=1095 RepID=UPI0025C3ADE5|nr:membrane protein insertase YidC [Chlorobium sp.]MCF8382216.1 membrane protein insertase YidC [Chlorobium sp.]